MERALGSVIAAARRSWPDLSIADEAFARHLAEHAGGDPLVFLAGVHAADLYLALGCTLGDEGAIAAFERDFMARVPGFLRASGQRGLPVDDVQQAVRARVLLAEGRQRPRIADYTGRGPLLAWLRVTTARVAINFRARPSHETPLVDDPPGRTNDPELAYLKEHHRPDFEAAFEATLANLPPRDAAVLKLHFVDGMAAEAIARSYAVTERTVHRWLAEARQRILDETHGRLAEELQLPVSQVSRLAELVRSQADVSVARILAARARRKE